MPPDKFLAPNIFLKVSISAIVKHFGQLWVKFISINFFPSLHVLFVGKLGSHACNES